jgi:hypothetical protein
MKLSELIEEFFDVYYTVKRTGRDSFEVAKFASGKQPERVDHVWQKTVNNFDSDSPGFYKVKQKDKSILIVKQFLNDKEPELTSYKVSPDRKVTSYRNQDHEGN